MLVALNKGNTHIFPLFVLFFMQKSCLNSGAFLTVCIAKYFQELHCWARKLCLLTEALDLEETQKDSGLGLHMAVV